MHRLSRGGEGGGGVGIYAVFTTVFKNYHLYIAMKLYICDTYKMEISQKNLLFLKI